MKIAGEGMKSVTVQSDVMEVRKVYIQEATKRTEWNDSRWQLVQDGQHGGGASHSDISKEHDQFREMLSEIRREDLEIEYLDPVNKWA
jgi:hypothetical protein